MGEFFGKILNSVSENLAQSLAVVIGLVINTLFGYEVISDPLYHDGWIVENRVWFILILLVTILFVFVCVSSRGLFIILALAIIASIIFGYLYKNSANYNPMQREWIWILHWLIYASLPGIVAGGFSYFKRKYK